MKIIVSKKKLKELLHNEKNLGFVPTMGALHRGHVSLIKKCILENTRTIVTIFVNKPQFNKRADYNRYPRSVKKDIVILKKLKINFLYLPIEEEIYPNGQSKNIKINPLSKKLCGKFRPGHFKAVVDVVNRFINIIKPKKIYFGEKDMQQLKIIDDFVRKNHKNTKVIGCKTIREKNGVACSSRNFLLSSKQKIVASKIYKLLVSQKPNLIKNKLRLTKIEKKIKQFGVSKIEYIQIFDINKLIKPYIKSNKYRIFISYYLGSIRLIDNI
tara:strand:+ start:3296 stop:4105 length:810 start_codon:yes stop_codon:yes gene_type:complete